MRLASVQAWIERNWATGRPQPKESDHVILSNPPNLGWPYWLNFWKGMGPWDWVSCFRQGMKLQWRTAAALGKGHPVSQYADSHSLENGQLWWMDGCFPKLRCLLGTQRPTITSHESKNGHIDSQWHASPGCNACFGASCDDGENAYLVWTAPWVRCNRGQKEVKRPWQMCKQWWIIFGINDVKREVLGLSLFIRKGCSVQLLGVQFVYPFSLPPFFEFARSPGSRVWAFSASWITRRSNWIWSLTRHFAREGWEIS